MSDIEFDTIVTSDSRALGRDSESIGSIESNHIPGKDEIEYPDGGLEAYLVIAGSFCGTVTCLGLINAIGSVQAYVSSHQLSHMSALSISWIFSIYLSLAYAIGVFVGPIFDYNGSRIILATAAAFIFAGLMGAASSSQMYQFILSFISLGVGNGIGMPPLIAVINHWFLRKRGLMTGVVTCGGSVGGLAFPLLLRYAFEKYGYVWAMRILAFISTGCVLVATVLAKERIRRQPPPKKSKSFDLKEFTEKLKAIAARHSDKTFWFTILGSFCAELSLVLTLTYFVTYAMAQGIDELTGYLLLTIWNACSIAGRILPGLGSDFLGKYNVNIFMLAGHDICLFVIWYALGHSRNALFTFAGVGGFFSGLILGLIPACLGLISKVSEFGERYGVLNFCLSFGNLVGVPIGAAIIKQGRVSEYDNFVLLVACLCLAGMLSFVLARFTLVGIRLNVKI